MPPPLAITDVRYVGDPVAIVIAESRYLAEDACEAIEVDYEPQQPVVDYMTAAADTDNIVHAGWGLESNAMVAVPFMALSPDLDERVRERRARRGVRRRAEPLRRDADGDARDRRVVPPGPRRARDRVRDAVGARDPQLLQPLPPDPRRQRARHRARRRRRIRAEDVRVPRGVRRRPGVVPARSPGEVDRGPPREPARRPATRATSSRHVRMAVDDDGDHPGHHRRRTRPTSARTRCARRRSTRCSCPGRTRSRGSASRMEMVWTNTMGKARVPRPVDVRDHRARDGDRLRRPRDRSRSRRVPAPQPARGLATSRSPRRPATCSRRSRRSRRSSRRSRSSTTRRSARSRRGARGGPVPRPRDLRVRGADVDGRQHAGHRGRHRARSRPAGEVVAFLGTTSHGQSVETTMAQIVADTPRRRLRRRHRRAGRHAVARRTAPAPAAAAPRSSPVAPHATRPSRCATRCCQVAAHLMEASPDDLEIAESIVSVRGTPTQVDHRCSDVAQARVRQRRHAAARARRAGSRRPSASVPSGSPRGRTRRTSAWSRSTPTPGCRW